MALKVCFRGDSRRPTTVENLFSAGFQKRSLGAQIATRGMGPKYAGDVEPTSAVCVSARISAAALFPLYTEDPAPVGPNYLYMMAIDIGRIFNTHALQVTTSLNSPVLATKAKKVMWPVFAQELAVDSVAAAEIIAAVSFTRAFFGDSWEDGGTYTLDSTILLNPACKVVDDVRNPALAFLRSEIEGHRTEQLPTMDGGFHKSEPKRV